MLITSNRCGRRSQITSLAAPTGQIYLKLDVCIDTVMLSSLAMVVQRNDPHANRDDSKGPLTCSLVGLTSGFVVIPPTRNLIIFINYCLNINMNYLEELMKYGYVVLMTAVMRSVSFPKKQKFCIKCLIVCLFLL